MNKIKYIFQLLVLVTFFGCADDEIVKTRDIEVTAGFTDTRTTFTEGEGVTHVNWEVGDAIGLFSSEQSNLIYWAQNTGQETEFSTGHIKLDAREGETVYAYYPHTFAESPQRIDLPYIGQQNYKKDKSVVDFLYAFGKVEDNKLSLKFNHLYSFLKITIPESLIADRGEYGGLVVKSTEIIANTGVFDIETQKIVPDSERTQNRLLYIIPTDVKDLEITCYIAIEPQSEAAEISIYKTTDGMESERLITKKAPKGGFLAGNVYTLYLNENEGQAISKQERDALIAFYKAAEGDNWQNNENWCSEKPVREWFGIETDMDGRVERIHLLNNALRGNIGEMVRALLPLTELKSLSLMENGNTYIQGDFPEDIYSFTNLEELFIGNRLEGEFSSKITQMTNLKRINVQGVRLSTDVFRSICTSLTELNELVLGQCSIKGSIPEEIGNLKELTVLHLAIADLEGTLPNSVWTLPLLRRINLQYNPNLTGTISSEIQNLKKLDAILLEGCGFSGTIPEEICNCTMLEEIQLNDNKFEGNIPVNIGNLQNLFALYLQNNNLTGTLPASMSKLTSLKACHTSGNRLSGKIPEEVVAVWDKWSPMSNITPQQEGYELTFSIYSSSDYSKDGEIQLLQKHTEGNGIPVILMGDAFVDTDMESEGVYDAVMNRAMEAYFSIEPMTSLRPLFDIYSIRCVSENRVLEGNTALECYMENGDEIGGNNEKILKYASLILGKDQSNALINIVMNNEERGGVTLYLSDNCTITFNPLNESESDGQYCLEATFQHEAIGHGLGLLGDEYTKHERTIGEEEKAAIRYEQETYGWWSNIDCTNNPTQILWSKFLSDERYEKEDIGIYEGGFLSTNGVYRPSYQSIMNNNIGIFNAPSREAIYKRAMKLAYGDSWTYDYETFVKWDMEHYPKVETRAAHFNYVEKPMENHRPPVIINQTSAEILKQK